MRETARLVVVSGLSGTGKSAIRAPVFANEALHQPA